MWIQCCCRSLHSSYGAPKLRNTDLRFPFSLLFIGVLPLCRHPCRTEVAAPLGTHRVPMVVRLVPALILSSSNDPSLALDVQTQNI